MTHPAKISGATYSFATELPDSERFATIRQTLEGAEEQEDIASLLRLSTGVALDRKLDESEATHLLFKDAEGDPAGIAGSLIDDEGRLAQVVGVRTTDLLIKTGYVGLSALLFSAVGWGALTKRQIAASTPALLSSFFSLKAPDDELLLDTFALLEIALLESRYSPVDVQQLSSVQQDLYYGNGATKLYALRSDGDLENALSDLQDRSIAKCQGEKSRWQLAI